MSLAKTSPTTFAPTASRRTLSAGLLAVIAGGTITSGIAAGVAASVGDLVPADPASADTDNGPNALCASAMEIDTHSSALMDATGDMLRSDPRWSPAVDEALRTFAECSRSMNHAAEARAETLECANFDALCARTVTAAQAVTADGHAIEAAAAVHHLYYRLSEWEQGRNPALSMLKGIAGDAHQSVEARSC